MCMAHARIPTAKLGLSPFLPSVSSPTRVCASTGTVNNVRIMSMLVTLHERTCSRLHMERIASFASVPVILFRSIRSTKNCLALHTSMHHIHIHPSIPHILPSPLPPLTHQSDPQ